MQFSFSMCFSVCCHTPGHTVFVSLCSHFSVFSPYPMSYSVPSIFHDFIVSCHILGPTVWVSHFSVFQIFAIFQVLQCAFRVSTFFSKFLIIFQVLQCSCLIFHIFKFSHHTPGPRVCICHFPHFLVFLAIFHILPCVFFILYNFQFSRHTPGPTVCISHFPHFYCLSPYSRSNSV